MTKGIVRGGDFHLQDPTVAVQRYSARPHDVSPRMGFRTFRGCADPPPTMDPPLSESLVKSVLKGGPFTYETVRGLRPASWWCSPQRDSGNRRMGFRTFRRAREPNP